MEVFGMKVKNLYVANIHLITKVCRKSNFDIRVTTENQGYKILEKKDINTEHQIRPEKRFYIPESTKYIDAYYGQKTGELIRSKRMYRLSKFYNKEDITLEEIAKVEELLNEKGLIKIKSL